MILECPRCGAKNRVDEERARVFQPVCGRCRTRLPVPGGTEAPDAGVPLEVTDAAFEGAVLGAGDRPVLVDCWAPWCGPCRMVAPAIDKLAAAARGRYVVAKLNVDENPRTAAAYDIRGIPALLIFKRGQLVDKMTGVQPAEAILGRLERHL